MEERIKTLEEKLKQLEEGCDFNLKNHWREIMNSLRWSYKHHKRLVELEKINNITPQKEEWEIEK